MFCRPGAASCLRAATPRTLAVSLILNTIRSVASEESESRLSSMGEDLRKKGAVFPSNLLHHIPKIQWIKPYTPKLTITAEATGA